MQSILNSRILLWSLLALPGLFMLLDVRGGALPMDQLEPSGRWAAWLLLVALSIGPLLDLAGPRRSIRWLVRVRRSFGVAAFGYAALHICLYAIDLGALDDILAEVELPSIWTGWLALILMTIPAALSNDASVRALGRIWKSFQRLVYAVVLLTFIHWALLAPDYGAVALTFSPFLILTLMRIISIRRRKAVT